MTRGSNRGIEGNGTGSEGNGTPPRGDGDVRRGSHRRGSHRRGRSTEAAVMAAPREAEAERGSRDGSPPRSDGSDDAAGLLRRGGGGKAGPGPERARPGRRMGAGATPREQRTLRGWLAVEEGRVGQAREEWERGPTAPRGGGQRRGNKDWNPRGWARARRARRGERARAARARTQHTTLGEGRAGQGGARGGEHGAGGRGGRLLPPVCDWWLPVSLELWPPSTPERGSGAALVRGGDAAFSFLSNKNVILKFVKNSKFLLFRQFN